MNWFVERIIDVILHLCYAAGLWLVVYPLIENYISSIGRKLDYRMNIRFRMLGEKLSKQKNRIWLYRHIDDLLYLTKKNYEPGTSVFRFFIQVSVVFVIVFIVVMLTLGDIIGRLTFGDPFGEGIYVQEHMPAFMNWQFPLLLASLSACLLYLKLRYDYATIKVKSSYDLLEVVKLLPKFANYSVDTALQKVCDLLSDDNVLRRPLALLAVSFSNYGSKQELLRDAQRFSGAIGTTFAVELVSSLLYAKENGSTWLTSALTELHRSMEQQREAIFEARSNSRDAILLGKYVNAGLFIFVNGTVALSIGFNAYIRLQFYTSLGLTLFSIILILIFISFVIGSVLSRPVLDYY